MNTQKARVPADAPQVMLKNPPTSQPSVSRPLGPQQAGSLAHQSAMQSNQMPSQMPTQMPTQAPTAWEAPRTVIQQNDRDSYEQLKDRLAQIPSQSRQTRQSLYIDLWTGQHWLGITLTYPEGYEILKPVSVDTALSIATIGSYKLLNQPLFEDRQSGKRVNCR